MIRYAVLGSGSCGNSYVFFNGTDSILVDCGFSLKEMTRRLEGTGIPFESIRALFLTHLHPDHGCGAGVFARKTGLPVIMSSKAYETETTVCAKLNIPSTSLVTVEPGEIIEYGAFCVSGFYTTHDSAGSMGWSINVDGHDMMILTDSGTYDQTMVQLAGRSEVLFLEANYDVEMLRTGPYPLYLKKRIAGNWGHLSNDQAFSFLQECRVIEQLSEDERQMDVISPNMLDSLIVADDSAAYSDRKVYFIHLSAQNNDPELVAHEAGRYVWHGGFTVCERGRSYIGELA